MFHIAEFQSRAGVQARTLRYWIKQKLLPKPVGRGRAARYTAGHLLRAKVIRHLRVQRTGFREIRSMLQSLSEEQLAATLPRPAVPDAVPAPPPEPSYPSASWELVQLNAGLFMLVNPRRGPVVRQIADQIYRHYAATGQSSM
jgi:DNA-binding transcriptional MerR regulator